MALPNPPVVDDVDTTIPTTGRVPAVIAVAAVAGGMLLDQYLPFTELRLIVAGIVLVSVSLWLWRRAARSSESLPSIITVLTLATAVVGGAVRHHTANSIPPDDMTHRCNGTSQLVRVIGVIAAGVEIRGADESAPPWAKEFNTRTELDCERIYLSNDDAGLTSCRGRMSLRISGPMSHAAPGDRVEILARWRPAEPAWNPGGFDGLAFDTSRGLSGSLYAEHPEAIRLLEPATGGVNTFRRFQTLARKSCGAVLQEQLPADLRGVSASLLLGDRTATSGALERAFIRSGTMHLLAVSGINVALSAGLVWLVCRLFATSTGVMVWIVFVSLLLHLIVADARPPIQRAAISAALMMVSLFYGRQISPWNLWGVCLLIVILWEPRDLFDTGGQLSFLAVAALIAVTPLVRALPKWRLIAKAPPDQATPLAKALPVRDVWVSRLLHKSVHLLISAMLVTGAVWVFTLPLSLQRFHFAPPIGLLANLLVGPVCAVVLWLGYTLILIGVVFAPLAALIAPAYTVALRLMLAIVQTTSEIPYGNHYCAGPPHHWVIVYYLLLGMTLLPLRLWRIAPTTTWRWTALACWTFYGLWSGLQTQSNEGLHCTFIAVGHGNAVLLELPNGKTLLYDGGSFGDPRRAATAVRDYLWFRRRDALSAIVISHADSDHFNGVPELLNTIPVGSLFFARSFLDFKQPGISDICDIASSKRIPIRLVQEGDRVLLDPDVQLRVLHPAPDFVGGNDNAHSVILEVEYHDRRLLLTGDLEGVGLTALMTRHQCAGMDVLMSPHHGGRTTNPPELARWAAPHAVVASCALRDGDVLTRLRGVYGESSRILTTATSGAITCTIRPNRQIEWSTQRDDSPRGPN